MSQYLAPGLMILICALVTTSSFANADAGADSASVPGGVYVWNAPDDAQDITFNNKPVMRHAGAVFIGIPMSAQPGQANVHYTTKGVKKLHAFAIVDKAYTEQHLTIANKAMVNPPQETQERISTEAVRQRKLYNSFSSSVDLSQGFKLPLQGITTSLFGHRRFFNGQPRSPHSGLDIAAETGTAIQAAGNATVVLADELYFNGNTLFLDHGQGLITMYCHMSELKVKNGDKVSQGQTIGLVGATGRVTGPHLHWSVSVNGNRVDPEGFMQALNAASQTGGD